MVPPDVNNKTPHVSILLCRAYQAIIPFVFTVIQRNARKPHSLFYCSFNYMKIEFFAEDFPSYFRDFRNETNYLRLILPCEITIQFSLIITTASLSPALQDPCKPSDRESHSNSMRP